MEIMDIEVRVMGVNDIEITDIEIKVEGITNITMETGTGEAWVMIHIIISIVCTPHREQQKNTMIYERRKKNNSHIWVLFNTR